MHGANPRPQKGSSLMLAYRLATALGVTVEELYRLRENMEEEDRKREEDN